MIIIALQPLPDSRPAETRLRIALKQLLRLHRLRCVGLHAGDRCTLPEPKKPAKRKGKR